MIINKHYMQYTQNIFSIYLPLCADILSFQLDDDFPVIFTLESEDPKSELIERKFIFIKTWQKCDLNFINSHYIGTISIKGLHLFELKGLP